MIYRYCFAYTWIKSRWKTDAQIRTDHVPARSLPNLLMGVLQTLCKVQKSLRVCSAIISCFIQQCIDMKTNKPPDWSRWHWYTISFYYVMCQMSLIIIDDHVKCEVPNRNIISIAMMLVCYTFLFGIFVGAWTSTQVESYRRHAQFSRRLDLIKVIMVSSYYYSILWFD